MEETEAKSPRMQPVMILPKGELSPEDLALLRANGICCVEAEHPDEVRFMEPPPTGYERAEWAAIQLFRYVVNYENRDVTFDRRMLVDLFARYLIEGTPLAKLPIKPPAKVKGSK